MSAWTYWTKTAQLCVQEGLYAVVDQSAQIHGLVGMAGALVAQIHHLVHNHLYSHQKLHCTEHS